MAAEIAGGAFLSTLFQSLFDKLGSSEYLNFFRESKISHSLLMKLRTTMLSAKQLHYAAEEKQFGNPPAREWLFELKDAICLAEELLDKINYEALHYEHVSKSGIGSTFFKRLKLTLSGSVRTSDETPLKVYKSLEHIMEQKEYYGVKVGEKERTFRKLPAPLVEKSSVYGRKDVKEKIVSQLLTDDSDGAKISIIPIVGIGGIGKTTLAQLVYEDSNVRNHFDVRAWATVSDDFDILKIVTIIFKDVTEKGCGSESLDQPGRKLKEALTEKKFLVILDDVWNEKYENWDLLKSHFQSGARGSKIIVTTRSDKVANVMGNVQSHKLEELSDDDCWSLFVEHVFGDPNPDSSQSLLEIGREIVKKCKGLPLAVKALAGLLHSVWDPEEWQKILKSNIWELQLQENTSNNILPSLWLSYHYLPSHLKRCFTYCSILPKDYEIAEEEKQTIVRLWMAEGLLQLDQKGKRSEDVGNEYFEDLISRSLFQRSSKDRSIIVMHDRVHDLAVFLSGEFCFRLDDNDTTNFSSRTRHLSYSEGNKLEDFEGLPRAKSLRTCVVLPEPRDENFSLHDLLTEAGGCLRALCLSRSKFKVLPDSIVDSLKLLRYLDLSWSEIEELPNALCSSYYLQALRLSYCSKITKLPTDMGNLVNLRHLEIKGVPLQKMPQRMRNLKDLETLSRFVVGKNDCSSLKELRELHHLSGKLTISELQHFHDDGDYYEAILEDKKYLNFIEYSWSSNGGSDESQKERRVLDALKPHTDLKILIISGYRGKEFSNWVGHASYANLVTVKIIRCSTRFLPPLGQLPSLQDLYISGCDGVVEIGYEFYGESSLELRPFRSLKSLEFEDMLSWQKWSFLDVEKDNGCFPSLENLCISNCPELDICYPMSLSITMEDLPKWKYLCKRVQDIISVEELCISRCANLERLVEEEGKGFRHLTSLKKLYIGGCGKLQWPLQDRLPETLVSLRIDDFQNLEDLSVLGIQHLVSLQHLRIWRCGNLHCLPADLPSCLEFLTIIDCPLLEARCRRETGEDWHKIAHIPRVKIERQQYTTAA